MENNIDNISEDNAYDENFEKDLIVRINKYDAIDLLSKVSCSSFFLKTTIFQFDDETENYFSC